MLVKKILVFLPLAVTLFLVQSYFWVPSYEEQTRGNPKRLQEYITASIGDASMLNPILSSDSASSEIEDKVFEGLIGLDRDLGYRGRVASSWEVHETAFFAVHDKARVPGLGRVGPEGIKNLLDRARKNPAGLSANLIESLTNIEEVSVAPGQQIIREIARGQEGPLRVRVTLPPRIKLELRDVDQDLFKHLTDLLGEDYFTSFSPLDFVQPLEPSKTDVLKAEAGELLQATEHNPFIVFHLRPGVTFHDGHVLDARDVKFTFEAIMNPKNLSPRVSSYEAVKEVVVADDLTVKVVYSRLFSPALISWAMGILPEHLLNREALDREARERGKDPAEFSLRDSRFNRHPVGCGPFTFQTWESDQYIMLEAFDQYWEGKPNYETYVYRVIPDLLTQEMEFYAGTLDSYSVQPHQVERLKDDPRFQHFSGTSFGYTYIGYNLRRAPFDDLRVRRALSMALDIDKIITYVLYGQGERITGPFVKQTEYYDHGIPAVPFDPRQARELLRQAGWAPNENGWMEKDGQRLQFTLITNTGNDIRKAILAIAQDAWRDIGVDVKTDTLEWSVFIQERVNKLDFDAVVLSWSMSVEPDMYQIWHSSQTDPYELNFVGFEDGAADELILDIRREYEHEAKVESCHRLHRIIARELPYTFLFVQRWTALLDKRIVIKDIDASGQVVYKKITPTKTGSFTFDFNKWIKLPEAPNFAPEG